MHFNTVALAGFASLAAAASSPSICDKYTTALLMDNTPKNQLGLLTKLVNTAVIGNYTTPNMNAVTGILNPGEYMGTPVALLKYFDGTLASTNQGGSSGVSVNFLDGGGAAPLKMSMPASDTTSNQYMLLTHLYSYFGLLLGCSGVGMSGFPAYGGDGSMYQVHKFMKLDPNEVGYFIAQVGSAAQSFGVSAADIKTAATALTTTFDMRCAPPATVDPSQGMQLQAICTDPSCPEAPNPVCNQYMTEPEPATVSGSMAATASMPASTASSAPAPNYTGGASSFKAGAGLLGSFGAALMLL